jgi:hypothetical protein
MRRECDLVMKGGVTSGVVYPPAIYAITRTFDLRSIGGTSAGAIAAALAAAAQYRRVADGTQPEAGYEALLQLPEWLGSEGHLFGLFAPNRATQSLFRTVVALFAPGRSIPDRLVDVIKAYVTPAAIGAAPGLLHALIAGKAPDPLFRALHRLAALVEFLGGTVAGALIGLLVDGLRRLDGNAYGLVTGVTEDANPDALCTWLCAQTEEFAGLPVGKVPLTFGMLWDPAKGAVVNGLEDPPPDPCVNLSMMTTNIVEGRPYVFPTRTDRYRFRKSELARFFPPHVVTWLIDRARISQHTATFEGEALIPLPVIGDLPIIVATRMSLAFPLLLSAVPMYSLDHNSDGSVTPRRVFFSDGGLASNFPIALFDSPLPRRPTLAINLGGFPPGADPKDDVVMAEDNQPLQIYPPNAVADLQSFGGAIFSTMQNWNDAVLARLPGYRDRIVTVRLSADEGGLNLNMGPATIAALVDRGRRAGERLVQRFADPSTLETLAGRPFEMSWENHRWVRYRTIMSELRELLAKFARAWSQPAAGDVPYPQLVRAEVADTIPRHSYRLPDDPDQRAEISELSLAIAALGKRLADELALGQNEPHPPASLVTRAQLDHA